MARISVMTRDKAHIASPTLQRGGRSLAYFDGERNPLHLHLIELQNKEQAQFDVSDAERVLFLWRGSVEALGADLAAGSSIIIEKGRGLSIVGGPEGAAILVFAPGTPTGTRAGGHVHLLPLENVPRTAAVVGASGVTGGMHADSSCESCEVWLHENHFPGGPPMAPEEQAKGVHSHTEDEIIFVTKGQIRLGTRLYEAGTALAIASDTFYSFTAGPEGMSFVNFRASTPGDILFANGITVSETGYWSERVKRPSYLSVG